jgi:hypothetical protein
MPQFNSERIDLDALKEGRKRDPDDRGWYHTIHIGKLRNETKKNFAYGI